MDCIGVYLLSMSGRAVSVVHCGRISKSTGAVEIRCPVWYWNSLLWPFLSHWNLSCFRHRSWNVPETTQTVHPHLKNSFLLFFGWWEIWWRWVCCSRSDGTKLKVLQIFQD